MYSIKELYKVGCGPSSSHTMGPTNAALEFIKRYPKAVSYMVILYGSLALTGKGHLTDVAIEKTMMPKSSKIIFDINTSVPHPNTMDFKALDDKNNIIGEMRFYSIGGGAIEIEGEKRKPADEIYPHNKLSDILQYCKDYKMRLSDYVDMVEGPSINEYLENIYNVMMASVDRGIKSTGVLPGKLRVKRKANYLYYQRSKGASEHDLTRRRLVAYAYAVAEENASGGEIVTAPTCGASGIVPATLRISAEIGYSHESLINGLKVAGLIGNLIKHNASISGAEAGCQAEIGTACCMAASFIAEVKGCDLSQVASAAEIALEHHLGLTCDPVEGYVQIPCIERNAVAALRAYDASKLATYLNNEDSKISFDVVVETMKQTGHDLNTAYRETSQGGLAKTYKVS